MENKTKTVAVEEFIAGFLQHVLPYRFIRVRSYGLLNPGKRDLLDRAQDLLGAKNPPAPTPKAQPETPPAPDVPDEPGGMKSEPIQPPPVDPTVLPSYFEVKTFPLPPQEPQEQKLSISTSAKPLPPGGFLPRPDEPAAANPKPINCPKCGKPMQWITDCIAQQNHQPVQSPITMSRKAFPGIIAQPTPSAKNRFWRQGRSMLYPQKSRRTERRGGKENPHHATRRSMVMEIIHKKTPLVS